MKDKVLVLYGKFGGGHKKVADYIREELLKRRKKIESVDAPEIAREKYNKIYIKNYSFICNQMPILIDLFYQITKKLPAHGVVGSYAKRTFSNSKIHNFVIKYKPDVIISTHSYANTIICDMKQKELIDTKSVFVITDYVPNSLYVYGHEYTDAYVINNPQLKKELVKYGVDKKKIHQFGIPISKDFKKDDFNKRETIKELNLDPNKKTVLFFSGGGYGSKKAIPFLEFLMKNDVDYQIIFIAGEKKEVYDKAKKVVNKYGRKDVVLGFVSNVPELMNVSDIVITKPGGITITECINMEKPMILIHFLKGWERENQKFITKSGCGILVKRKKELLEALEFYNKEKNFKKAEKNFTKIKNEKAMDDFCELIDDMLKK